MYKNNSRHTNCDEYDILRRKWISMEVSGDMEYNAGDTSIKLMIKKITDEASGYWTRMEKESQSYLWEDLDDDKWSPNVTECYRRLMLMGLAYSIKGSNLYKVEDLRNDIVIALDWMYRNRFNENTVSYGDWWDWEVGSSYYLVNCMMHTYEGLDKETLKNYIKAIDTFTPGLDHYVFNKKRTPTESNERATRCMIKALEGILVKDRDKLRLASNGTESAYAYASDSGMKDGFFRDGSLIKHRFIPYAGAYGIETLKRLSSIAQLLKGSKWEIKHKNTGNLYEWIHNAYEPLLYKGSMMDMVRGRNISRKTDPSHNAGKEVACVVLRLAETASTEDSKTFRSMAKEWLLSDTFFSRYEGCKSIEMTLRVKDVLEDGNVERRGDLNLTKVYYNQDRIVCHRPGYVFGGYAFGISMSSERIYNYECCDINENKRGWYTGDGMTYLYNDDQGQYDDNFWPTVDVYRLPGTTVDTVEREERLDQEDMYSWAGGVELKGLYGAAGMYHRAAGVSLSAKKSWFIFDNEIVALGSEIQSTDGRTIETIIENRRLNKNGDNLLTVDGIKKSSELGWNEIMDGVGWMHLEGTGGYYFPVSVSINAKREARTGDWSDIGNSSGTFTRNYTTFWFDHGKNPSGETYCYVILPGRLPIQTEAYAKNPDIEVLENSGHVHAVRENRLGITGINFWDDALVKSRLVSSDRKAFFMMHEEENIIQAVVSDPTQRNRDVINIEIDIDVSEVIEADPEITIKQLSPVVRFSVSVNDSHGKTFKAKFAKIR